VSRYVSGIHEVFTIWELKTVSIQQSGRCCAARSGISGLLAGILH